MEQLCIAIEWQRRWQEKINSWQRWYGSTVSRSDGSTVTTILADCEENRRKFVRGVI